jgi:hypothetical protein
MISFNFWKRKVILQRPIDQAIAEHKRLLKKWESKQQKEIVAALLQSVFPAHHLRHNPTRKDRKC